MSVQDSVVKYMNLLPAGFRRAKSGGLETDIQFNFTDPQVGSWVLEIRDQGCTVRQGTAAKPSITVEADPKVFMDIQEGKVMANMAVSRGRLRLAGDLNLAFRVGGFFELPRGLKLSLL
ncbi:MAG: SCP2 sterol-binding domain-containing protein [Bryobacteraceae bacterium]